MSGLVTTTSGTCLLQEQQRISIAKAGIVCRYGDWVGGWVGVWVGVGGWCVWVNVSGYVWVGRQAGVGG